jgi:ketosteroid isomerase-like protein
MEEYLMADPLKEDEVRAFLKRFVGAYEAGDAAFFDNFTKDVSVFSVSSPTRIDGIEEYKRGFEENFLGQKRRSQILSPEIRIAGDAAIVTYHNRIAFKDQSANARVTLAIVRERDGIRVAHLHISPLSSPGIPAAGRTPDAVTLLEERVATAAAAMGTPK